MFAPPPPSARKRKRGGEERLLIGPPFVLQPYISASFDVTTKVSPSVILPRSHIPISWLAGAPSRLFNSPSELPVLCAPGNVVIVKIEGERQLSAVESIRDNVYALYRLSTQLRMKDVRKVAAQTKHLPNVGPGIFDVYDEQWWNGVGNPSYPFTDALCSANHAALDMGLCKLEIAEAPEPTTITAPELPPSSPPQVETENMAIENTQPTISEVLDQVQHQYYDTLYLAKTSLAYFAKSTLSRARATCQEFEGTPPATRFDELIGGLRKLLLPLAKMDMKYRKTMVQSALEKEIEDSTIFRQGEEDYVHRWRLAAFEERYVKEADPILKQKLEELRIRETELQIILLLEILALNKEHPPTLIEVMEPPKGKGKNKSKGKGKKCKKGVDKEPDPELVLELLVDRLCIWHSVGSDTAEKDGSPAKGKDTISEKDHLRHFSVEVIMAFYASKLPDKCAYINKKFGGGRAILGPKVPSTTPRPSKTARERRVASKRPTGLTRTLTGTSISSRGTTAEPLSLIAAEGTAVKTVRGGTLSSRNFSKQIVEVAEKKPAQKKVDEELRSVIQALKRPNRGAAAAELVDDAERRLAKPVSRNKLTRAVKPPGSNVHVTVTPRKRKVDIFAPELFNETDNFRMPKNTAGSSQFPSSAVAATPPPRRKLRSLSHSPADGGMVLATPRRSLFADLQRSAAPREPRPPPRSVPLADTEATIFATPQKKAPENTGFWSPHGGVVVAKDLPLKGDPYGINTLTAEHGRPLSRGTNAIWKEESVEDIYSTLDWL